MPKKKGDTDRPVNLINLDPILSKEERRKASLANLTKGRVAKDGLTPQQEQFAHEYCVDFNKGGAALRVGISENKMYSVGNDWYKKPAVKALIDQILADRREQNEHLHDRIREELKLIAFSDITDVLELKNDNGVPDVEFKASEVWEKRRGKMVKSIKIGRKGIELSLHDKNDALNQLAKHTGFFEADNEQKKEHGVQIYIPDNGRDKEPEK